VNDLLTQGLASGSPIALLTQGLIIGRLFAVECLSIVLSFQLSAMSIAIATPSLEILAASNSVTLDAANNQINIEVLSQSAIALAESLPQVTLNVVELSIVLSFQISAMSIAIATPSLEMSAFSNSIVLDAANNQINIGVLNQTAIALAESLPQVILNVVDRCPTA